MLKGDTDLMVPQSMVKYNYMFATNNLSGSVIGFMGIGPWMEGHECSRLHKIINGRGQMWSILIT